MLRPALFVQNCDRVLFPDDFYARQFFSGLKFLRRALFPLTPYVFVPQSGFVRRLSCAASSFCGCRISPRVVMCRVCIYAVVGLVRGLSCVARLCGCRICYRRLSLCGSLRIGHRVLPHDAQPPRLRCRKKHHSRRASSTATAAPMAHTVHSCQSIQSHITK